jgi:hypothetical protein
LNARSRSSQAESPEGQKYLFWVGGIALPFDERTLDMHNAADLQY